MLKLGWKQNLKYGSIHLSYYLNGVSYAKPSIMVCNYIDRIKKYFVKENEATNDHYTSFNKIVLADLKGKKYSYLQNLKSKFHQWNG